MLMVDHLQNSLHPLLEEVQRWQNIIGYKYTSDKQHKSSFRSSYYLRVIATKIGRFVLRDDSQLIASYTRTKALL